ncbi:MAG: hypothetical protein IT427_06100 [Pirellulales bacterium]|nr:hypothetical protein [Pirellulales bacterium]
MLLGWPVTIAFRVSGDVPLKVEVPESKGAAMQSLLTYSPLIVGAAILLVVVACKIMVHVRYTSLPKEVLAAVESMFPESHKLGVEWNDSFCAYQIEIAARGLLYAIRVRPDGEIIHVTSEAEQSLSGAEATASHDDGRKHRVIDIKRQVFRASNRSFSRS